jgi:hypothetical protein
MKDGSSTRSGLIRLPPVELLSTIPSDSKLAVILHFGEHKTRKDILATGLIARGVYDRAVRAFKDNREPGRIGRPPILTCFEDDQLVEKVKREIDAGHFFTRKEISEEVFFPIYSFQSIFSFS